MAKDNLDTNNLAKAAFNEALNQVKAEKKFDKDTTIEDLIQQFESVSQADETGVEFWYARDLQELLEYTDYRNFLNTISKAKDACELAGQSSENHFVDVNEMVDIGSGATREIENIKLTRYACYLVAQNADSRKRPVSFAQTYFAIQTRRQELRDKEEVSYLPLTEDQRRLLLRDEIKEHNKRLASAAKGAGVVSPLDFAIFTNYGYKGLYGGLDRTGIARKKGIKSKDKLLDHMGSTELAANLFRATQTEEKLKRENIKGIDNANKTHYIVGQKVRQAIVDIGGDMPENLAQAEDILKVGRRLQKAIKNSQEK